MGKIKKFAAIGIRKIIGGKDPIKLVEEFILRLDFDPADTQADKSAEHIRWVLKINEGESLEILIENFKVTSETTVYMGIDVVQVPIRGANEVLAAALEIADSLVGVKVSLLGNFLILSATLTAVGLTVEELDYHYRLITAQRSWFQEALAEELGWESVEGK